MKQAKKPGSETGSGSQETHGKIDRLDKIVERTLRDSIPGIFKKTA
jgi:ferritin-like metal-binding protein YciE